MDLRFSEEDEAFRKEIADWLAENLTGEFEVVRGRGGAGDEECLFEERLAWERKMGEAGWGCVGWPKEFGCKGASLMQQVIYHEEYARAGGPGRLGHVGEGLLGPTVLAFGTEEQKKRFIPPIVKAEELWAQGYSEPNAGSDLANVQTKARLEGDEWVIDGQKVWTSGAAWSHWCFILARTELDQPSHKAISYLMVPMKQPGVEIRPIIQITGDSEFSEVFFDGARTAKENIIGKPGEGWKVAMGTLAFERGASTLGQQLSFQNELDEAIKIAKKNGKINDPLIRQRIADAWIGLRIMRYNALRSFSHADDATLSREAMITKLYWATWHRNMGKLAMDVQGPWSEVGNEFPYDLTILQKLFLFTRSDTVYAGTNQIQRNIISERGLGMPREPRVQRK